MVFGTAASDPLGELHPPLTSREAIVEADRCLYCFDAPCTHICPTHIDVPKFIKKIASGNLIGSALTILDSNLLGATCARVCPVQQLCEGACVLGSEHRPIQIGRLQRYALDSVGPQAQSLISKKSSTGFKVAVVGAGPAGLSCAGELTKLGHNVVVYEKRDLPGGLSTFGIISPREPITVALQEVEMIRNLGVRFEINCEVGRDISLEQLQVQHNAVFLAGGLGASRRLGIPGEEAITDGLEFIEASKIRPHGLKIGSDVYVTGAGNTAMDCATIAKRLGAARVTILCRRTERDIAAYPHEVDLVRAEGIQFRFETEVKEVTLGSDEEFKLVLAHKERNDEIVSATNVIRAVGQDRPELARSLPIADQNGFVEVNESFQTRLPGVFAGGDSVRTVGDASTVMAVQDGKLAAGAIHHWLLTTKGVASSPN